MDEQLWILRLGALFVIGGALVLAGVAWWLTLLIGACVILHGEARYQQGKAAGD